MTASKVSPSHANTNISLSSFMAGATLLPEFLDSPDYSATGALIIQLQEASGESQRLQRECEAAKIIEEDIKNRVLETLSPYLVKPRVSSITNSMDDFNALNEIVAKMPNDFTIHALMDNVEERFPKMSHRDRKVQVKKALATWVKRGFMRQASRFRYIKTKP